MVCLAYPAEYEFNAEGQAPSISANIGEEEDLFETAESANPQWGRRGGWGRGWGGGYGGYGGGYRRGGWGYGGGYRRRGGWYG